MINITDKSKCCGCWACAQICPKGCITMQEDSEGFLYPVVGKDSCIDCDLCSKVCPVLNHVGEASEPKGVYAAKHKDLSTRTLSASGGAFSAAAKEIIDRGGVVFGSVFNQDWEAEHKSAENMEDVLPMIGSKYMQSRIGGCYREAERFLKDGREVLFTGTSCQIKGLKLYLRKEYDNLFTADVICHAAPSPKVWRRWLKEEFQGKVLSVNFRDKGPSGWNNYHITIESEQGKVSGRVDENAYMKGFLNDLFLRPSCHECKAKCGTCGSDLTIADFWGIREAMPEFSDEAGVSLVICHTDKGSELFSKMDMDHSPTNLEAGCRCNPSYHKSVGIPAGRERFFSLLSEGRRVKDAVNTVLRPPFFRWMYSAVKRRIKTLIK